ncbi:chromosome partition protein Smc-like [Clytia hemisphaerica]
MIIFYCMLLKINDENENGYVDVDGLIFLSIFLILLCKAKAGYDLLRITHEVSLQNYEDLKLKYRHLEIEHGEQKDKNYRADYEKLKEKYTKQVEETRKYLKTITELEKLITEAKAESNKGKCQTFKTRLNQIRQRYRDLIEVNRECLKDKAKMKQMENADKEAERKCKEAEAKLMKMQKENLNLSTKLKEARTKRLQITKEHGKCKAELHNVKSKCGISTVQTDDRWGSDETAANKAEFRIFDEESKKFRTMIKKKLDLAKHFD